MSDRTLLGPADVADERLAAMLAEWWQVPEVEVLDTHVAVVDYDLVSILTGGRFWVTGRAEVAEEERAFRLFVKICHAFTRSPLFAEVPPEHAAAAAGTVPWQAEPCAYRSDLARNLPAGLRMPHALAVVDLDDESRAVWLESVETDPDHVWDRAAYVEAAGLLGRLSGSPAVAPYAKLDPLGWEIGSYVGGRVTMAVLPALQSEAVWQHPLVAASFSDDLRRRMLHAADRIWADAEEYASLPHVPAHGDACPNNLLRVPGQPGFTLIDFGFWHPQPPGFDLGQLVLGELQLGRRSSEGLAELDAAVIDAYCAGLAAEGAPDLVPHVRRGHALAMLMFHVLPSLPVEDLGSPLTGELGARVGARAAAATYALDLLEATER